MKVEWIDVKDRVPTEFIYKLRSFQDSECVVVIAQVERGRGFETEDFYIGRYRNYLCAKIKEWIIDGLNSGDSLIAVKYWMPLPEMPKYNNN